MLFEPSNVSLPTDLLHPFSKHLSQSPTWSIPVIHHHFLIRKSMAQSHPMGHSRWFQVSGIYISIDFPQKNPHPLWRFHHPKEQFFFKRNIENYTSPDFFSPRKNLGILLLEHNSNPTFFPPKNHPKSCGLPSGGPTGFTPLLGYPNHFASRQLK